MNKLAIVTFTRQDKMSEQYTQWVKKSIESVNKFIPADSMHHIIECSSDEYNTKRWDALKLAEYVCFVDEDDIVLNDSIRRCKEILDLRPEVSVVFTNEQYINEDDEQISSPHNKDRYLTFDDLASSPQHLHHLCMIRTNMVDWTARKIANHTNTATCWLIKAGTALNGVPVHLNIDGYAWRQHSNQMNKTEEFSTGFDKKVHIPRVYLASKILGRKNIERID